jgi:hypothetical protein
MNERYLGFLVHWISEREAIRYRREVLGLSPPWTADEVLRDNRFCNVHREDDKVTRWIKKNWRDPYAEHDNLAFAMCLARVVNWPDTLRVLEFPEVWDPTEFVNRLDVRKTSGSKVWTGAYMVTGGYSAGGESKQTIMARVLSEAYINCEFISPEDSLVQMYADISSTNGLGSFLAAQAIADIKYAAPYYRKAEDWDTFCAPGPGSCMGLNFLHGRNATSSISKARFTAEVNHLREWVLSHTDTELTAHDMQNCLCELSKYIRIRDMGMKAKNTFNGRTRNASDPVT